MTGRSLALPLAVALLVLVPGAASAESTTEPQITDPTGDASPAHDLQAAWFETEREGLRFTVRVAQAGQPQHDVIYYVAFTLDGNRVMAGIGYDDEGRLLTYVGRLNVGTGGQGLETFANGKVQQAEHHPGRPSDITGVLPFGTLEGLEAGATLIDLTAGVDRVERGRQWVTTDLRNTDRTYEIESVGLAGFLARGPGGDAGAGLIVGGGLAVAIAAAGGAYAYSRRGRHEDESAPAPATAPPAPDADRPEDAAETGAPAGGGEAGRRRLRLDPRQDE